MTLTQRECNAHLVDTQFAVVAVEEVASHESDDVGTHPVPRLDVEISEGVLRSGYKAIPNPNSQLINVLNYCLSVVLWLNKGDFSKQLRTACSCENKEAFVSTFLCVKLQLENFTLQVL